MAFEINTIDDFQKYLTGVAERADHHGEDVNEAVFILAGLIVIYKDPEAKIEVRTYKGAPANILRTTVGGVPYAFAYNHETQEIEIRDRF